MSDTTGTFQPVEIDELDDKLMETAARKRIPSLRAAEAISGESDLSADVRAKVRTAPRKALSIDVPDYLATRLKVDAAEQGVTVRYLVLSAIVCAGYEIKSIDLEEDGRRLR